MASSIIQSTFLLFTCNWPFFINLVVIGLNIAHFKTQIGFSPLLRFRSEIQMWLISTGLVLHTYRRTHPQCSNPLKSMTVFLMIENQLLFIDAWAITGYRVVQPLQPRTNIHVVLHYWLIHWNTYRQMSHFFLIDWFKMQKQINQTMI